MSVSKGLALAFAIGAAGMDLAFEKVDNRFLLAGWLAALWYQREYNGLEGMREYFLGVLLPIVVLFGLFWLRMLGAGDIKLLSVLGGIMGAKAICRCIFFTFLFGGILSAAILWDCGNVFQRFNYFSNYIATMIRTRKRRPYYRKGKRPENIHFTIPILLGVMLYVGGLY